MAITLTTSKLSPPVFTLLRIFAPPWINPVGRPGSVYEITRPGFALFKFFNAWSRRVIEAWSVVAPPSMSKSSLTGVLELTLYLLSTAWYAACRVDTVVHPCASSVPEAPPNEMITSPPAARTPGTRDTIVVPLGNVSFATVAPTPPHVGVQPPLPTTNPRVKTWIPDGC